MEEINFIVVTVATQFNYGLERFIKSCNKYNIKCNILGMNTQWYGGDMQNGRGGFQKIHLLKKELLQWNEEKMRKTIILFTDSYDVIFLADSKKILDKYFQIAKDKILFSAEKTCWPDTTLKKYYNEEVNHKNIFLNSGGFIGKASDIFNIINVNGFDNDDDDQLYFTKIYLFNIFNSNIILDYNCEIFQTLNNSLDDITVSNNKLFNISYNTAPCVLHGNGPSYIKEKLNEIYLQLKMF